MSDDIETKLSQWSYRQNINWVTKWHNMTNAAYAVFLDKIEDDSEVSETDKVWFKEVLENTMDRKIKNYCLIMHLSNFEEISHLVCDKLEVTIPDSSSLSRFKEGWEKRIGKNIGNVAHWQVLTDAEKIRHCILHASERISFMRNPNEIKRIIKKEQLKTDGHRVIVTGEFLNKVINAIVGMVDTNA